MKQIVDKLNKIAKKIDGSVEIPQTDLIIDSLDAITKAYGGTPNDSNLIVDKLEDIAGVAHSGITPSGNIEITENTAEGEPLDISQYATATVNVAGGGASFPMCTATVVNTDAGECRTSFDYVDGKLETTFFEDETTAVCHFLYVDESSLEGPVSVLTGAPSMTADNISNLVNLSFTDGLLVVTDPTQDSSVTIDAYAFSFN